MRAVIHCLALAPLLVLAGCGTVHYSSPPLTDGGVLSPSDFNRAEAMAHYSQALISEVTLGEALSSQAHFRKASECDPVNFLLAVKVAVDFIGRKDYTGAVTVLERTVPYHPDSLELQLLLGTALQGMGHLDEAQSSFSSVLRLAPDRHEGYVRLGVLYVLQGKPRKALHVVDSGLSRAKDTAPIVAFCVSVGQIYLTGGEAGNAIPFVERAYRSNPGSDALRELLGRCYAADGRTRAAIAEFSALSEKEPKNSAYAYLLGMQYERQEQWGQAQESFQRAIRGYSPDPEAWFRLATLQIEKEPDAALATLKAWRKSCPADLKSYVFMALLYVQLERYEDALSQFERVEKEMEQDEAAAKTIQPLFYFWYGEVCDKAGRRADAERILKKYLSLCPDSPQALNALAYLWAERGRYLDQALEYITQALKAEPDNGAYLDTWGWICYKKGDFSEALLHLTRAVRMEEKDPVILDHLGDVLARLGRQDKAVRMWRKSLACDPGQKAVREKLIQAGVDKRKLP